MAPGAHTVTLIAPAHAPFSTRVQLGAGELRVVHAALKDAMAHNADAPNVAPPPSTPPPPSMPPPTPPPVETGPPPPEHTGRFMANIKLGFTPLVYQSTGNLTEVPIFFTFTAELGVGLCCHNRLYLVMPFSVNYKDFGLQGSITLLEFPLGLQCTTA